MPYRFIIEHKTDDFGIYTGTDVNLERDVTAFVSLSFGSFLKQDAFNQGPVAQLVRAHP